MDFGETCPLTFDDFHDRVPGDDFLARDGRCCLCGNFAGKHQRQSLEATIEAEVRRRLESSIEAEVMRRVADLIMGEAGPVSEISSRSKSSEEAQLIAQRLDEEERQQRVNNTKFTCGVCHTEQPINGSYEIPGCSHRFCRGCISNCVECKIVSAERAIRCPCPSCGSLIPLPLIQEVASKESWVMYQSLPTLPVVPMQVAANTQSRATQNAHSDQIRAAPQHSNPVSAAVDHHDVVLMHCCSMCNKNATNEDPLYSIGTCNHTACGNCLTGHLQTARVSRPALAHEPNANTPTVQSFHSFPTRPELPLPAECEPELYLPVMVSTMRCPLQGCTSCITSEGIVGSHSLVVADFCQCIDEMTSFISHLRAFRTCALQNVMFCDEFTHVGDLFQLGCGHFFHHACIAGYLRTAVEGARAKGSQDQIVCYKCSEENFICSCFSCDERMDRGNHLGHIYTEQEVCSLVGDGLLAAKDKDNWSNFSSIVAAKHIPGSVLVPCPHCNNQFFATPTQMEGREVICPFSACGRTMCPRCRFESHAGISCDQLAQRKRLIEAREAGIGFLQKCPNCPLLWNVPMDCFHVTCEGVNGCGQQFCFLCGASHTPTLVHGNWYHRPGCSTYNPTCDCVQIEGQLVCLATDPLATCVKSKYWPGPCDPCIAANTINTCTHGQNNWRACNACINHQPVPLQCKHYCLDCRKKGSLCTPPGNPPDLESGILGKLKFELFERQAVLDEQARLKQQSGGAQEHGT